MTGGPLLQVRGVGKRFGGLAALDDVHLTVPEGSVTALIGPNGAGKTTLFNCLTGFARPDTGEVVFAGRRVDRMAPQRIARLGMVRTFQSIRMFAGLTVYESLLAVRSGLGSRAARRRADELLDRLGLAAAADRRCTELPLLAQRMVEVARALMTGPRLLLLDEPSAGATAAERDRLVALVADLRRDGTTVMVIEHNVGFVMAVSDQIVVLNFGRVVATGGPAEVAADPIVQEIYLGV